MTQQEHGFLIEMTRVGAFVRVCAIDTRTRVEVTMVGDPSQGEEMLKRLVAKKLRYVLNKKKQEGSLV